MKTVKLEQNQDGDYTDGYIIIKDIKFLLRWTKKSVDDKVIYVPGNCSCHCFVTNMGSLLSKLTVIFTAVDCGNYNIASVQDSVICLDNNENWEFYAKSDDLGYWKSELSELSQLQMNSVVDCGKTRGQEIYNGVHTEKRGYQIKVYAIEEFSDEDYSSNLGQA